MSLGGQKGLELLLLPVAIACQPVIYNFTRVQKKNTKITSLRMSKHSQDLINLSFCQTRHLTPLWVLEILCAESRVSKVVGHTHQLPKAHTILSAI